MDNPPDEGACEVTITAPDREWLQEFVGRLVERRLAAAAHVDLMQTTYRWAEQVHSATEARAVLHTTFDCLGDLERLVHEEHPYEVPCLVGTPLSSGSEPYLRWVAEVTRRP